MAAGKDVHLDDLPPELLHPPRESVFSQVGEGWQEALRNWVDEELKRGHVNIAKEAIESAEGILITTALGATRGRRQEAAKLLGYGRNTLTRKIAELHLDV
jgi:two-component system nitrogen regulation response regulator GlnG